ncbi:MAG: hemolysin family protein [Chloroflexota bacterium]
MIQLILAVLAVLIASGLCSGTEAALFSIPIIRVRQLVESQERGASSLLRIRENMNRPIASIVILNNIDNIVGRIVVGGIASTVLGDTWLGVFSAILTFLVIIFSEIIPKTLGEQYAERISLLTARPVLGLTYILTPLVWLVEKITAPITKGKPISPTTDEAEIRLLAKIGRDEGIIEPEESEMIQRVFHLNDVTAAEIMTPRVAMTHFQGNSILGMVKEAIIESPHSRIIITDKSPDDVLGVVQKNVLLTALVQQKETQLLSIFAKPVPVVLETTRADKLLSQFQQSRQHLAIVHDKFGGVAGVITLEDVLETLTGEIVDETDEVVDMRKAAMLKKRQRLLGEE